MYTPLSRENAALPAGAFGLALVASTLAALALAPIGVVLFDVRDHDGQRVVELMLLAVTAGMGTLYAVLRLDAAFELQRRLVVVLTVLAALAVSSIWSAAVTRAAALEAGLAVALVMFALGSALAARRFGVQRLLIIPVAASLLFAFAVAVRYAAALSAQTPLLREHLLPAYSNYRFFNHVQTVTIPLLLAAAVVGPRRYGLRRWAGAALVLEFCLLFFTGGRATMLALGIAAAVVAVAFRQAARAWLVRLGVAAVAGGGLYLILFNAVPIAMGLPRDFFATDVIARSEAGVGGPREYLWRLAWQYIRESPLLGIGPMHYAHRVNLEAAHPHNVYLQLAAEWGVPFAVLVVAIAAMGWFRLLRKARASTTDEERALGLSLVAAGAAIAVDGMFSGNFVMPMSQLWIAFAIGLALAYARQTSAPSEPAADIAVPPAARWTIVALCVASQIAIWCGVWPEILDVNAHVDRVRGQIVHNVVDNPRIWSHGWFR